MRDDPTHLLAVTAFVRDADGRVLLVRVAERGWELPGGQVEHGEDLLSAVRREVEEESGCIVEPERLIATYSRVSSPEMVVHLFGCRHVGGAPRAREAAVPEVGWFAPGHARRLVTRPAAAVRLGDALTPLDDVRYRAYRMHPYTEVGATAVGRGSTSVESRL